MVCQNNDLVKVNSPGLQQLDQDLWYADIILFLLNITYLGPLKGHKTRSLRLKSANYCITQEGLGRRNPDIIILRCVNEQ